MKYLVKTYLCICVTIELFNAVCTAVQTSLAVSKSAVKPPVYNHRSVFTIVRFLNIPCSSPNGQLSGVCYSLNDCVRLQGTQIGTCASGFGVCCIFQRTCGQATNQNFTHFTNPGYPEETCDAADCNLTLLRSAKQHICQVRLDFLDFQLANPTDGECLDDKFTVQGNNANSPVPELCGNNAGQHMYIDVENSMTPINLKVAMKGLGCRKWNMKVSYIECSSPSKAPPGCLQYYTGPQGSFSSFNYNRDPSTPNGGYINNLNYAICFRKEFGKCSQTYIAENIDSFLILNLNPTTGSPTVGGGEAGLGVIECPTDYLRLGGDRYCGARLNPDPSARNPTTNVPVTDTSSGPFIARFNSDGANNANGFNLLYSQNNC